MMDNQFIFIFKIFIFSVILSYLVKYGGRLLPIEPTPLNASLGILTPALIMGLALWWRERT